MSLPPSTTGTAITGELEAVRTELDEALAESARVRVTCGEACGCRSAASDDPAIDVVDTAITALLSRPPVGVEPAEVAGFARRHRERLVELVRARLGTGGGR